MKQVYCQNPILNGSEKPRFRLKTKNQNEFSSTVKVLVVKIAHFSKWCDSKWQALLQKKVRKRSIWTNTKNYRSSRLLKLKKLLSPKRLQVLQACMLPLPKMVRRPLEQDKPLKVQHPVWKIKKLALVVVLPKAVPTGDLENSTMTMMTISITQKMLRCRKALRAWQMASRLRRRSPANTLPGEPERRAREAWSSSPQLRRILPPWKLRAQTKVSMVAAKMRPKLNLFSQRVSNLRHSSWSRGRQNPPSMICESELQLANQCFEQSTLWNIFKNTLWFK